MNQLKLALPLFALFGAAAQAQSTDARQPLMEQRQQLRQLQLEGQRLQRLSALNPEDRARYSELTERRGTLQAELLALQVRALTARNEALRGGASAAAATVAMEEVLGARGRELQTELREIQTGLAGLTRSAMQSRPMQGPQGATLPGRALPPQAAPRAMQQLRQRMQQQMQRQQQQQRMPQHRPPQQRR